MKKRKRTRQMSQKRGRGNRENRNVKMAKCFPNPNKISAIPQNFSSTGTFCVLNQIAQTIVVGPPRPPGIHLVGASSELRMEAPRIPGARGGFSPLANGHLPKFRRGSNNISPLNPADGDSANLSASLRVLPHSLFFLLFTLVVSRGPARFFFARQPHRGQPRFLVKKLA